MERRRSKTLIGLAMIVLGLVQAGSYAIQDEWIPVVLGLLYSGIGIAYLLVEVSAIDQKPR